MVAYGIEHFPGNRRMVFQCVVAGRRMGFDECALLDLEPAWLVENGEWNFGLADVVKHRGHVEALEGGAVDAEAQAEIHGDAGDQQTVLISAFMVAANGGEPVGEAVLGDTIGNPLAGSACLVDVDLRALEHGCEHRGDAGGAYKRG